MPTADEIRRERDALRKTLDAVARKEAAARAVLARGLPAILVDGLAERLIAKIDGGTVQVFGKSSSGVADIAIHNGRVGDATAADALNEFLKDPEIAAFAERSGTAPTSKASEHRPENLTQQLMEAAQHRRAEQAQRLAAPPVANPFAKPTWNLTEQGRLFRFNRQLYDELKAGADHG